VACRRSRAPVVHARLRRLRGGPTPRDRRRWCRGVACPRPRGRDRDVRGLAPDLRTRRDDRHVRRLRGHAGPLGLDHGREGRRGRRRRARRDDGVERRRGASDAERPSGRPRRIAGRGLRRSAQPAPRACGCSAGAHSGHLAGSCGRVEPGVLTAASGTRPGTRPGHAGRAVIRSTSSGVRNGVASAVGSSCAGDSVHRGARARPVPAAVCGRRRAGVATGPAGPGRLRVRVTIAIVAVAEGRRADRHPGRSGAQPGGAGCHTCGRRAAGARRGVAACPDRGRARRRGRLGDDGRGSPRRYPGLGRSAPGAGGRGHNSAATGVAPGRRHDHSGECPVAPCPGSPAGGIARRSRRRGRRASGRTPIGHESRRWTSRRADVRPVEPADTWC